MSDETLFARKTCQALVITCSDFRFKRAERAFTNTAGLVDDFDLLARPGGIRSIVMPRDAAARESMHDEIRILWGLHKFTRIICINHLACGAYADIATPQNEREVHTEHLRKARDLLDARFAGVRAETYLAEFVDDAISVHHVA